MLVDPKAPGPLDRDVDQRQIGVGMGRIDGAGVGRVDEPDPGDPHRRPGEEANPAVDDGVSGSNEHRRDIEPELTQVVGPRAQGEPLSAGFAFGGCVR